MTEPTASTPSGDDDRAEQAFRDALKQHADEPDFKPLDPPAPGWRRGRLPRWVPVAAAAALVAAVGIPLAIGQLRGGGGPTAGVPADARATQAAPTMEAMPAPDLRRGWRWESYRVLSYQVPDTWTHGWSPVSDWCTGRPETPQGPFVDIAPENRPVAMILCPRGITADRLQSFVTVRKAGAINRGWDLPAGWKSATKELDGYVVEVVHTEGLATVAEQILASVRPIGAIDPNGCPATSTLVPERRDLSTVGILPTPVSLCQYDLATSPAQLLASKALSNDDERLDHTAREVLARLVQAPKGTGPDDASCDATGDTAVLVRQQDGSNTAIGSDIVVRYSGCRGNGVFDGTTQRKLTREVCEAVLQPPLVFTTGHGKAAELCTSEEARGGTLKPTPGSTSTAVAPSGKPTR